MEISNLKIEKGRLSELNDVFNIYRNSKIALEKNNIYQWMDSYPSISIIEKDLSNGFVYVLKQDNEIIGAISLNEEQEDEYNSIEWQFPNSKALVIHRLVISPKQQRKGYATILMNFAENWAKENMYSSIRLDAFSQNKGVIDLYKKRNYFIRGSIMFSGRNHPFYCMEKEIRMVY